MSPLPGISVVVPVYNAEATLRELIARVEHTLKELGCPFEVVLVNDGSLDRSWEVVESLAHAHDWVRGMNLMRNYGQHNALLCGVRAAKYPITVIMDDDLQHPPEEIPRLLEKMAEGYDVVYGTPESEQHEFWRNLAARFTKLTLQSVLGAETARKVSPFRALRTQLRDAFAEYQSPFVSLDVLLTWGTNRFGAVTVRHEPRRIGRSQYTFWKLMTHALNMTTGFSVLPLQLATAVGFTFTLFGILVLAYVIGRYLILGINVPGFTFLASTIAIFSGAQLFALGIMGEYLARMHFRMLERPPYVIQSATSESKSAGSQNNA
ncbi:MAG: glycosyltransferase family 2 protein [Acidobacteria bacterium]|nr:glycosyltransferase family 2 protein [Acidobacteriota bacterium]